MLQRKVATHEFTHSQFRGDQRQARRAGIASFIGTTIEWYDFYIYGTAAALVFGDIFFSDTLPNGVGTLLAFITLWAGFLARPIGGIIFGHLGDRIGRKNTLVITLMMMGVATVGIGLLPTYAQVGIWAPIGLVTLRVIQGVAVGGEWGGAVLIASENAPKGKSILYSAFAQQAHPPEICWPPSRSSFCPRCRRRRSSCTDGASRSSSRRCWSFSG